MSQDLMFTVAIDPEETKAIFHVQQDLAKYGEVEDANKRGFDWQTFTATMKDISDIYSGGVTIYTIAKMLHTHLKGKRAKLQAPNKAELDLQTASEQEVLEWLLKQ